MVPEVADVGDVGGGEIAGDSAVVVVLTIDGSGAITVESGEGSDVIASSSLRSAERTASDPASTTTPVMPAGDRAARKILRAFVTVGLICYCMIHTVTT